MIVFKSTKTAKSSELIGACLSLMENCGPIWTQCGCNWCGFQQLHCYGPLKVAQIQFQICKYAICKICKYVV